jgi:hypothetical protein
VHLQRASNFFGPRSKVAGNNDRNLIQGQITKNERTWR